MPRDKRTHDGKLSPGNMRPHGAGLPTNDTSYRVGHDAELFSLNTVPGRGLLPRRTRVALVVHVRIHGLLEW